MDVTNKTTSSFNPNINKVNEDYLSYLRKRTNFKKLKNNISNKFKKICEKKKTKYIQNVEQGDKSTKKIKKKKIYIHILHTLLFFVAYFFYYLSLERCFDGEDICSTKQAWMTIKVIELFISIIISSILFLMMIHNKISPLNLIHFIIIFILFYNYSHETLFHDHGYYNFTAYFGFLWLIILIGLCVYLIILLIKSKYKYILIGFFFIIILLFIIIYFIDPVDCNDWPLGLNNTYLENDKTKYGCQIKLPKSCTYKVLGNTQDISLITNLDCSVGKIDARRTLLEYSKSPYVNKNTKTFGFPLTNNDIIGGIDGKDKTILLNYTYENLLDMDNITRDMKEWPEHIVDFKKNPRGEMKVNLIFNETLSKERKNLEGKLKPYSNNIMILYIDSVSRSMALRQLKKTMKFVEEFMSYEGNHHNKYPEENYHSFQFFKYHSFKKFTPGNYPRLFYGNKKEVEDLVLITKYLKENGYVTNYCSDECKKDNTRTHHNLTKSEMYDHQMLLCDPNIVEMNKPTKKCLYGNINSYHLYEYGKQFWVKYKDNRKFSAMVTNDGHEPSLEALKYTDDILYNYLNFLYNKNLLKDTSIFMLSDHGTNLPSVYFLNDFFQVEAKLPMLYLIINDRKNISYNEQYFYIHKNQQTFITAYDIYNTIANVLYGDEYINIKNKTDDHDTPKSPLGQSLFTDIDQMKRTPKNYEDMNTNICK